MRTLPPLSTFVLSLVVLRLHRALDTMKDKHKQELADKEEEAVVLRRRLASSRRYSGLAPIEPAQRTAIGSITVETYTKNEDAEGQHVVKYWYKIYNERTGHSIVFSDGRFERVVNALKAARNANEGH